MSSVDYNNITAVKKPNYGAVPTASPENVIIEDEEATPDVFVLTPEEKGSNWTAYVHIVCVVVGSGTLGIPYALSQGGWCSLAVLLLSAVMSVYSNNKLIESLYHDGKTRKLSMPELASDAFGKLAGQNFYKLFRNNVALRMEDWVYLCAAVMTVPFVLSKNMKEAAWISLFGVLTAILVVVIVSYSSVVDYPNHPNSEHDTINLRNIPIAMGTFSFGYGGNVVFPNVEAGMKDPSAWPKVNYSAIASVTLMYLLIGIPAYLTYGRQTLSPIYLSLPDGWTVTISIIMITAHVLLALTIYLTSICLEIEGRLGITVAKVGRRREFLYRTLLRSAAMVMVVWLAITAPYFADVMALLGAMANGLLVVVIPVSTWIKLFGWDQLRGVYEKLWVVFVLIFASVGSFIGTSDAMIALWNDITKND
ncbi:923_t:CDS:2 [Ambispora leptoticha]|uniref:923_t:CDS:1 n=1 Tax=Ambispora leptoticha TaxID=144679 RepID=A0A9N9GB41_9GLOM|nr:923_t:CDS:2 [Ambispora leptoticha]